MVVSTRELVALCGDNWPGLFPKGRTVYVIVDALEWKRGKSKVKPVVARCIVLEIWYDDAPGSDQVWLQMENKDRFGYLDARIDDDSFFEKVFLFEDEAHAALKLKQEDAE
ncbi:MAG: hypothetical protein GXW96_00990 [Christensenellaceae bacterium]|nr:hypothetical protein [Christensenellaceae bacterium]